MITIRLLLPKFKPKRRWSQFSLLTMFVVVTAFCIWLGLHVHAANRQRTAVAALEALDVQCWYDYQMEGDLTYDVHVEPPGPAWLRESLGIDHFATVVRADLQESTSIGRALPHLLNLPGMHELSISVPKCYVSF